MTILPISQSQNELKNLARNLERGESYGYGDAQTDSFNVMLESAIKDLEQMEKTHGVAV